MTVVGSQSKVAVFRKIHPKYESELNHVMIAVLFLKTVLLILLLDCKWHENKVFFNTFDLCWEL